MRHETTSAKIRRVLRWAVAVTVGVLLTANCAAISRHQVLTFFFDGVPPETPTNAPVIAVAGTNHAAVAVAVAPAPARPKPPENTRHKPFAEGKCVECHGDIGFSPKVTTPLRQLCFSCHKDFVTPMKVRHQPVEDGDCLSCHSPHESPNKNLLVKKGNELCLSCHDDPGKGKKYVHQAVEAGNCVDCHSPHATNFKGLLRQSVKNTCADCHDDITKKKDVHQPVGDGDCLACHTPHASNNKFLVKKTGPSLCFDCHDDFRTKAKFTHDVVDDCGSCHNPHSTDQKGLLKKNIASLCMDCHDQKDLAKVKAHADIATQSCTVCHDPHVGADKNLLKASKIAPFAAPAEVPITAPSTNLSGAGASETTNVLPPPPKTNEVSP